MKNTSNNGSQKSHYINNAKRLLELRENIMSKHATRSQDSLGRNEVEDNPHLRSIFQVDRDRIIHTRAFRRLKHKTQVFIAPDSDHVVTRMTHTIEVQQIARTIAKALGLNEDLTEAIALGHDLGHTPFGHAGEEKLAELLPTGFRHNEQSLRIVEKLEKNGKGLNLTFEVRDGILRHSKGSASVTSEEGWGIPSTLEGEIVKLSDGIAYLNHDIQDAIRAKLITEKDIPSNAIKILGNTHSERINTLVHNCVETSLESFLQNIPQILLSGQVLEIIDELRSFMFERVYLHESTLKDAKLGQEVLEKLFIYYLNNPQEITGWSLMNDHNWRRSADYVSGMTDHYAISQARKLKLIN
tara:strand:- start:30271 stop:31338 length:1068 start_codon:yes stop_codon:yes gene_type:complete